MKLHPHMIKYRLIDRDYNLRNLGAFLKDCVEANKWCIQNMHARDFSFSKPSGYTHSIYTFRFETDLSLFLLTWNDRITQNGQLVPFHDV